MVTNKRSLLIAVATTALVVLAAIAGFWARKPLPEPLVVAVANTQIDMPTEKDAP